MESLWPFITEHPRYARARLLDRLIEPERIIIFRVSWVDDKGEVNVNRGYRIQHSSSIGPYKGGTRFHPSVNLSILKFLAFEQTFKNALTTLPMGGGKGGSDFDPKAKPGRGDAFLSGLYERVVSPYWFGYRCAGRRYRCWRAGSGLHGGHDEKAVQPRGLCFYGQGSEFRRLADPPGSHRLWHGVFCRGNAQAIRPLLDGLRVSVSGSGNVAQYAVEKAMALGAKVVTVSDSSGTVVDEEGFTPEKLAELMDVKNRLYARISDMPNA